MNKNWKILLPELQAVLDDEVAKGNECGCQLCIIEHGEKVVDIASGHYCTNENKKVSNDTLFAIFSSGKPVLAALAWKLMERGIITHDTPVGKYWEEFNTPDKSGITIEHLLSHRAGMYLLPSGNPDLCDWEGMCSKIAAMTPRNLPGEKCHYHPLTYGWLVGHTLELATGRKLQELLNTELITPLGLNGKLYFGIDDEAEKRVIDVDDSRFSERPTWETKVMNDPLVRRQCVPSFNGFGSACGLAEFYSKLRGTFVKNETFDFATGKIFRSPADPVRENEWTRFSLGAVLRGPDNDRRMFIGHGGASGAEAFYMPDEDIAFAFVKNRLSPKHPDHPVRDRISDLLQIPRRFW